MPYVEPTIPRVSSTDPDLNAKVATALDADGLVCIMNILSTEKVKELKKEVYDLLDKQDHGRNSFEGFQTKRLYGMFAKSRAFDDLAINPTVLKAIEHCFGASQKKEPFLLSAPTGIAIGPGEKAQEIHVDEGKYPLYNIKQELVMQVMWAIDDFTAANGSTVMFPKSHTWPSEVKILGGQKPPYNNVFHREHNTWIKEHNCCPATMPSGSVLIFRGSLAHGGGANRTGNYRLGLAIEYVRGYLRPQENQDLTVSPEIVANLNPKLQSLLGYNIFPPFMGYIDGRHPKKFLPKPNQEMKPKL